MIKRICVAVLLILIVVPVRAEELTIGWIGALTGDAAGIGTEILGALQAAVRRENAGPGQVRFRVLVEDDGYEVARALTAYEKLKGQVTSRLIFMSTYGALFALGKRPEQDGVLILDTLDCNDQIVSVSRHHLCLASRTESIADNFLSAIRNNGGGKTAVLYEEEAWFNFIVAGLRQGLGTELLEVTAPVRSGDYRSQLTRVRQSGAKHLVLLGNDSMGRAVKQAADLKLQVQLYSIAGITSPGFQSLAGPTLEGAVVSHWEADREGAAYRQFHDLFVETNGKAPMLDFVAAPTFDAAGLALSAVAALKPPVDASALRAALISSPAMEGLCGRVKFDPDGAVRSVVERLFLYRSGKLVPVRE